MPPLFLQVPESLLRALESQLRLNTLNWRAKQPAPPDRAMQLPPGYEDEEPVEEQAVYSEVESMLVRAFKRKATEGQAGGAQGGLGELRGVQASAAAAQLVAKLQGDAGAKIRWRGVLVGPVDRRALLRLQGEGLGPSIGRTAPSEQRLRVGDAVLARCRGGRRFHAGEVRLDNQDGTFVVRFAPDEQAGRGGDRDPAVPEASIRRPGAAHSADQSAGESGAGGDIDEEAGGEAGAAAAAAAAGAESTESLQAARGAAAAAASRAVQLASQSASRPYLHAAGRRAGLDVLEKDPTDVAAVAQAYAKHQLPVTAAQRAEAAQQAGRSAGHAARVAGCGEHDIARAVFGATATVLLMQGGGADGAGGGREGGMDGVMRRTAVVAREAASISEEEGWRMAKMAAVLAPAALRNARAPDTASGGQAAQAAEADTWESALAGAGGSKGGKCALTGYNPEQLRRAGARNTYGFFDDDLGKMAEWQGHDHHTGHWEH